MSTNYPDSKQELIDESAVTPVIYTKQNVLYDTVEALQDSVGYVGDLAADSGSQESRIINLQNIGAHTRIEVAAAATLTLPKTVTAVVTGTGTITTINATGGDLGRFVILDILAAAVFVDNGTTLDLDSDFTGPGRLAISCNGNNSWFELFRSSQQGSGHVIKENGTPLTDRAALNFSAAFDLSDDSGNDETDIGLVFGTAAGTVAQGNDSRLSDARTPTAHASSHITGGSDIIPVFTINTRGLVPGPSTASGTKFLNDAGQWVPASSAGMPTIYGPDGTPLTQRTIIQAVGEMAEVEDVTDDRTTLSFRFTKVSATTVASSGTIVDLPTDGNIIRISGTNTITTIPAPDETFRLVILYFQAAATVENGTGNIEIDGDFEAVAGSMLGLFYDSANWVEAFRSHRVSGGGGGGHEILDAGTPMTQRAGLNFLDGFDVADDAGNDETEVGIDFGTGATQVAAGNHTHGGGGSGLYIPTPTYVVPTISGYTEIGTATLTEEFSGLTMLTPADGNTVHAIVDTPPAVTHWRLVVGLVAIDLIAQNYHMMGICTYQTSDGKLQNFGLWHESTWQLRRANWDTNTSLNASTSLENPFYRHWPVIFFEVEQTASNRFYRISPDGQLFQEWVATGSSSDFLGTPSHAGFFACVGTGGSAVKIRCIHFEFEDLT